MTILKEIELHEDLALTIQYYELKYKNLEMLLKDITRIENEGKYSKETVQVFIESFNEAKQSFETLIHQTLLHHAPEFVGTDNNLTIEYDTLILKVYTDDARSSCNGGCCK